MVEHCDFVEQHTTTDEEGRVLRPDVVVRLPGGKQIVIDSKVPLVAYLDAFREDTTEDERVAKLGTMPGTCASTSSGSGRRPTGASCRPRRSSS